MGLLVGGQQLRQVQQLWHLRGGESDAAQLQQASSIGMSLSDWHGGLISGCEWKGGSGEPAGMLTVSGSGIKQNSS